MYWWRLGLGSLPVVEEMELPAHDCTLVKYCRTGDMLAKGGDCDSISCGYKVSSFATPLPWQQSDVLTGRSLVKTTVAAFNDFEALLK